jgi:hypothetical protein
MLLGTIWRADCLLRYLLVVGLAWSSPLLLYQCQRQYPDGHPPLWQLCSYSCSCLCSCRSCNTRSWHTPSALPRLELTAIPDCTLQKFLGRYTFTTRDLLSSLHGCHESANVSIDAMSDAGDRPRTRGIKLDKFKE